MPQPHSAARSAYLASTLVLALGVGFGLLSLRQLRITSDQLEIVISRHAQVVIQVVRLQAAAEALVRAARSHLTTGDAAALVEAREAAADFSRRVDEVRGLLQRSPARAVLESAAALQRRYEALLEAAVSGAHAADLRVRLERFAREAQPVSRSLRDSLSRLATTEMEEYLEFRNRALMDASRGARVLLGMAMLSLAGAGALTFVTVRTVVLLGRTRREVERANERLRSVNQDLDAFAGRTAHDLRNILTPVRLVSARLRSRPGDATFATAAAERLERVAVRSERLITALLALARFGRPADSEARASVRAVLGEVLEDLAAKASGVGAEVRADAQDIEVACDPGLLHVVLANVLGNAIKYLDGCATRQVRVTARREGGEGRIAVTDTGPGIPVEWRERVFTPFVRVPGSSAEGSGIGLATVRRIVLACGGRVELHSKMAMGTTVVVHLPVARPGSARSSATAS